MIAPVLVPIIRRAILDLVLDTGGEMNDEELTLLLNGIGHRVARRNVCDELRWLADRELLDLQSTPHFIIVRSTSDGRDVASGRLRVDGVSRHKTDG